MHTFATLTTLSLLCMTVTAQYYHAYNFASTLAAGPFDMAHVYPLYVRKSVYEYSTKDVNGPLSVRENAKDSSNGECSCSKDLTGSIPVDIVYYGKGFDGRRKQLIENFTDKIKTHPIWGIVTQHEGGKPYIRTKISLDCNSSCKNSFWDSKLGVCYKCQLGQYDLHGTMKHLYNAKRLIPSTNGIVIFLLGTDITFTFSQSELKGQVMGNSQLCATQQHGLYGDSVYSPDKKKPGLPYIVTPLLKTESSPCNFLRFTGGYANDDYRLDALIATLFHELVERILSRVADDWANQIADKCANRLVGIQSDYSNIVVNGEKYTLPPLWDQSTKRCSMRI